MVDNKNRLWYSVPEVVFDMKNVKSMVLIALFAALIGVGAFIKIPIPPVPVTLQTFFTLLAGLLLGAKAGAGAALLYIFIGLVGIPVFTAGGGPSYVFQPTFGYIIGLALGAFISGFIAKRSNKLWMYIVAAIAGMLAVYVIGVPYLYLITKYYMGQETAFVAVLGYGFLSTLPKDIIVSVVTALIAYRVKKSDPNLFAVDKKRCAEKQ